MIEITNDPNVDEFKKSINKLLPTSKYELSWIIDKTGDILFHENWESIKPPQLQSNKECKIGMGIIISIKKLYKDKNNVSKLINYLFSSSLERLINK